MSSRRTPSIAMLLALLVLGLAPASSSARAACEEILPDDRCEDWTAVHRWDDGNGETEDAAHATNLLVGPDGTVFVSGVFISYSGSRLSHDFNVGSASTETWAGTVAYEGDTGATRWASVWSGEASCPIRGSSGNIPNDLALSPDGETLFVVGAGCDEEEGETDWLTLALDASSGERRWAALSDLRLPGDGGATSQDAALTVGVSPDGDRVYVGGDSFVQEVDLVPRGGLIAFDARSGEELWRRTNSIREAAGPVSVNALDVGAAGEADVVYFLARGSARVAPPEEQAPGDERVTVGAVDGTTGELRWVRFPGAARKRIAIDMELAPDQTALFITARDFDRPFGSSESYWWTAALDADDGGLSWQASYGDGSELEDWPAALAVSSDGTHLYVTGRSDEASGGIVRSEAATVAFDAASGSSLWATRESCSPEQTQLRPYGMSGTGYEVAAGPDGTVYATARCAVGIRGSTMVTALSPGGERLWRAAHVEHVDGRPAANYTGRTRPPQTLGVSPSGDRVVVATQTWLLEDPTWADFSYVTLSYRAPPS